MKNKNPQDNGLYLVGCTYHNLTLCFCFSTFPLWQLFSRTRSACRARYAVGTRRARGPDRTGCARGAARSGGAGDSRSALDDLVFFAHAHARAAAAKGAAIVKFHIVSS